MNTDNERYKDLVVFENQSWLNKQLMEAILEDDKDKLDHVQKVVEWVNEEQDSCKRKVGVIVGEHSMESLRIALKGADDGIKIIQREDGLFEVFKEIDKTEVDTQRELGDIIERLTSKREIPNLKIEIPQPMTYSLSDYRKPKRRDTKSPFLNRKKKGKKTHRNKKK